jgi:hypothetical protein
MSLAVSFEPQVQTIFPSRFRRPRQKWYLRAAGLKGGKHSATCATATLAEFEGLRSRRGDVHLCAFDLFELDGRDLPAPVVARAPTLAGSAHSQSPEPARIIVQQSKVCQFVVGLWNIGDNT